MSYFENKTISNVPSNWLLAQPPTYIKPCNEWSFATNDLNRTNVYQSQPRIDWCVCGHISYTPSSFVSAIHFLELPLFQPNEVVYDGVGANEFTSIIRNRSYNGNMPPRSVVAMSITGNVITQDTPSDLSITMLCYVEVNGCTEMSTANFMGDQHLRPAPNGVAAAGTSGENAVTV